MTTPIIPVGTRVIAVKNVGPLREGMIGVITGVVELPFLFWKRVHYLCTFVGNLRIAVKPAEIDNFDHGYDLKDAENPDFIPDIDGIFDRVARRHGR